MGKSKTSMGKDANGTFQPEKAKPSSINKEDVLGLQHTQPENLEEYLEMTDKLLEGEDVLAENVNVRHPNRKSSKGEATLKGKENRGGGNKTNNNAVKEDNSTTAVPEQLPGILTKERFSELANYKADCTISLYFPTRRGGGEGNEHFDPTTFKTTLQDVTRQLKEKGHEQEKIELLLKPGFDLIKDNSFWLDLNEGLAIFIADGFFKFIKMPAACEQKTVIESTFYVTPLISVMMTREEYFWLLVISKQSAKLFKADAFGIRPYPVDLPQSIEEVKRIGELDSTTYRRGESGKRAPEVSQPGQSHGGGGGNADGKDNIATYFEAVDDALWEVLNKENAPLLLAGVEYLIPIYKSVCDYHNVWEKPLTGNRDNQETSLLYKDAKEVMQPYFDQRLIKSLDLYGNKSATELTSSIVDDVIPAAHYGRVSHLFVAKGEHIWGTFDEMTNELKLHETPGSESEDLLDHAVVKTLATGGEVFLLNKEKMPVESPVAALMRY